MKTQLDCIPCFQRQALQAVRFVTDDVQMHQKVLRKVMNELLKADWSKSPPQLAVIAHKTVRKVTNSKDPYKKVKHETNEEALAMYEALQTRIENGNDSLLTAIKLAIAGNIIDYGALSTFDIKQTVDDVIEKPLTVNHYERLKKRLNTATSLGYVTDNAGEIVFDKLFLEKI